MQPLFASGVASGGDMVFVVLILAPVVSVLLCLLAVFIRRGAGLLHQVVQRWRGSEESCPQADTAPAAPPPAGEAPGSSAPDVPLGCAGLEPA